MERPVTDRILDMDYYRSQREFDKIEKQVNEFEARMEKASEEDRILMEAAYDRLCEKYNQTEEHLNEVIEEGRARKQGIREDCC